MIESIFAFLLILFVSSVIYIITKRVASKNSISGEEKNSMYACGEKMRSRKLVVNITLYKYLIFFVILDSPALILAFAASALEFINPLHLLFYIVIVLAADFLLLGGN